MAALDVTASASHVCTEQEIYDVDIAVAKSLTNANDKIIHSWRLIYVYIYIYIY